MSRDTCETVTIINKNGKAVINKTDFDASKHQLFEENAAPKKTATKFNLPKKKKNT